MLGGGNVGRREKLWLPPFPIMLLALVLAVAFYALALILGRQRRAPAVGTSPALAQ